MNQRTMPELQRHQSPIGGSHCGIEPQQRLDSGFVTRENSTSFAPDDPLSASTDSDRCVECENCKCPRGNNECIPPLSNVCFRVFVNRNLRLEKIQFFGFDMDYTLAVYKSPQTEQMTFGLIVERMIEIGYPAELRSLSYSPIFPVRGLWFDYLYGNLVKVDGFGNILVAVHGFTFLTPAEIEELYPNKFLHLSDKRVYVLNTLFNMPETYLVACLVDYFDKSPIYKTTNDKTGVKSGEVVMSYRSIFQDARDSVDWVHFNGDMKRNILENLEHYVENDGRCKELLMQLRASGRKTFLLTNSEYAYTNGVMRYLLGEDWTSCFDITVVDAKKPLWFGEGTVFREVELSTGTLKIGIHTGPLRKGVVYSGGSCDSFRRLVNARGKDVLYIGDHIFGDVLRSKKTRGWRTFLVVPELSHELTVWTERRPLFEKLQQLDTLMASLYKNLDVKTRDKPEIANLLNSVRGVTAEMDQEYGVLGSLFRSGPRTTFFASQVERYADLYASSCYNLIYYPHFYFFRAPMSLMPHESTVDHHAKVPVNAKRAELMHQNSVGQQVRGWNEKQGSAKSTTFCFEEEDEGEDNVSRSSVDTADPRKASSTTPRTAAEAAEGDQEINEEVNGSGSLNETDVLVPTSSHVDRTA